MATAQMNVRIDEELKMAGDAVLERAGLTPTQAIRGMWEYTVRHQQPPEFLCPRADQDSPATPEDVFGEDAGLAVQLFNELAGRRVSTPSNGEPTYKAMRDQMYDQMVDELGLYHE